MNYLPIDDKTLNVPAPLVEATLQYLWTRPMNEVFDLFTKWQAALQAKPVEQPPAPPVAPAAPPAQPPIGQAMHRDELAAAR